MLMVIVQNVYIKKKNKVIISKNESFAYKVIWQCFKKSQNEKKNVLNENFM